MECPDRRRWPSEHPAWSPSDISPRLTWWPLCCSHKTRGRSPPRCRYCWARSTHCPPSSISPWSLRGDSRHHEKSAFLFNKIKTELETLLKCKQTSQAIGSISELQAKDIIWWAVGVQGAGHLPAANEAVLPSQNNEGSVDELHQELLGLTWKKRVYKIKSRDMIVLLKCST